MSILGAASLAGGAAKTTTTSSVVKSAGSAIAAPAAKSASTASKTTATSSVSTAKTSTSSVAKVGPSIGTTVGHNSSSNSSKSNSSQPAVIKTISDAGKAAAGAATPAKGETISASTTGQAAASAAYTAPRPVTANTALVVAIAPAAAPAATGAGAVAPFLAMGALAAGFVLVSTGPAGGDSEREFEALVNAYLAAQGLWSEKAPKPADGAATVDPPKKVPNPFGKDGGPEHSGLVGDIAATIDDIVAGNPDVEVKTEVRVETPGGEKSRRFVDVGIVDSASKELLAGVQVGIQTKGGEPVSRERRAIDDINAAVPDAPIWFVPYK